MKSALKKSLFFLLLMALLLIGCSLPAFGENADELYVTDGITLDCRDFAPHTEEGDAESRWIGTNAECFLSGFLTEKGKSGFVSIGDGVLSVGGNVFGSGEYTVELVVVPTGKIDPETGKRLNTKTVSPETSESLFAEGYSSYSPVAFSLG
ncbi:MAG: hypothetical protein MJ078_06625 [Clostridia bacterium]|nr:hypothetical protein [Clostridia bacterium]